MAYNASHDVVYYLHLDTSRKDDLATIRGWSNLKIAFDGASLWVKDFEHSQITSVAVKSIPFKTLFYERDGKLFLLNSLLPDRVIPPLLWTAIDRALPITLPGFNHNYFGIHEKIAVQLVESGQVHESVAMITPFEHLERYSTSAPAIRMKRLQWALINGEQAFLLGTPLLPIPGLAFWHRGDSLLPAGYDFELPVLADTYASILNPEKQHLLLWNADCTYSLLPKNDLQPLSISSVRLTGKRHAPLSPR